VINKQLAQQKQLADAEMAFKGEQAAPSPPMAKVSQAFGDGDKSRVEYSLPVDQATKMAGISAYKSPYADDISDLGRTIAEHQSEIDSGDSRTGFLNMNSRQDIIDQAQRQRKRLQGQELQDMLANGVIDEDEANRRANLILKRAL
jgi:hypothetical protein